MYRQHAAEAEALDVQLVGMRTTRQRAASQASLSRQGSEAGANTDGSEGYQPGPEEAAAPTEPSDDDADLEPESPLSGEPDKE